MAQTMVPQAAQTAVPQGTPLAPPVWSLQECLDRFAQLYSWLKRFQDSIYAKRCVGEDWTQRAVSVWLLGDCLMDDGPWSR